LAARVDIFFNGSGNELLTFANAPPDSRHKNQKKYFGNNSTISLIRCLIHENRPESFAIVISIRYAGWCLYYFPVYPFYHDHYGVTRVLYPSQPGQLVPFQGGVHLTKKFQVLSYK